MVAGRGGRTSVIRLALFVLLTVMLGACGLTKVEAPPEQPTAEAIVFPLRTDLSPLDTEQCDELATLLAELGITFQATQAPFQDQTAGGLGMGCLVSGSGTGVQLADLPHIAEQVRALMDGRGWQEDAQYTSKGPISSATAFRREAALCLFSAMWQPASDADCPSERPLSLCALPPERKIYTIMLHCAQ